MGGEGRVPLATLKGARSNANRSCPFLFTYAFRAKNSLLSPITICEYVHCFFMSDTEETRLAAPEWKKTNAPSFRYDKPN